ncbi:MAG: TlyA family RNA methyltransferase [Myxococcales bacterium]|nr:TlyA family RNA methyltransferase [Myxococcales bacterium]
MAQKKIRLDQLLVERGLCESRTRAAAFIMEGRVSVGGQTIDKPGTRVNEEAQVAVQKPPHPFVSRGGLKLQNALEHFGLDARGLVALDAGCSTGGFSDCLLQRGVARVFAADVSPEQLHERIKVDPRVLLLPPTNVRHLKPSDLPGLVDLVVGDLSFISLRLLLPALEAVLRPGGKMLLLIKPQFEVGREKVGRGGIVRDERARLEAVARVIEAAASIGLSHLGTVQADPPGTDGNIEFFVCFSKP